MKLTKNNYYNKNKYITASKIKDFLNDKELFYKYHITGELVKQTTPAMESGKALDTLLTGGVDKFNTFYCRSVLKKDDPVEFERQKDGTRTVLTPMVYDKVIRMADAVISTPVYQEIIARKFKPQRILQTDFSLVESWYGMAGMLDWLYMRKGDRHAVIVDLKTTADADDERKFHYTCLNYEYYLQLAYYAMLVKMIHGIDNVDCFILAVDGDKELPRVKLYNIDRAEIDRQIDRILVICKEINEEKNFFSKNKLVSFGRSVKLPIEYTAFPMTE